MCEHNTTVTMFIKRYLTFEICTWGCGKTLICEVDHTGTAKTLREIEHPELAALRDRVAELEAAKGACEALLKDANLLFNQTAEFCDEVNSEEWLWKWKVRYYFEDTDIPPHALPVDMRGDE